MRLRKRVAGITLIETIIASLVLVSALAASVNMVGSSTLLIADNRNRLAATYLAQECLELTRNARDSASVQTLWHCPFFEVEDVGGVINWETKRSIGISDSGSGTGAIQCFNGQFDHFGVQLADASDALSQIELNGTEFTRELTIKDVLVVEKPTLSGAGAYAQAQQFTAQCDVAWTFRGRDRAVSASTILTRWKR